jgi:hypothetical protein
MQYEMQSLMAGFGRILNKDGSVKCAFWMLNEMVTTYVTTNSSYMSISWCGETEDACNLN